MPGFTMPALRRRPLPHRLLAWAMWLALLLPLAQFAAAAHSISHLASDAGAKHGAAHTACELCLAGAAVGAAAPPAAIAPPPQPLPAQAPPSQAEGTPRNASPELPYFSRAPPAAPF